MKHATGRCINTECSQYRLEKSFDIAMLYGYCRRASVVCPECGHRFVPLNRVHDVRSHVLFFAVSDRDVECTALTAELRAQPPIITF